MRKPASEKYGVEIVFLQIKKLGLPESITEKVFERMKAERQKFVDKLKAANVELAGPMTQVGNALVTAVIVGTELIAVEPGDTTATSYGVAYDLGTTTVVATLMDLTTGAPIAVASMLNQQQPFGADVISRISATMMDADALAKLQELAHETLGGLADEAIE